MTDLGNRETGDEVKPALPIQPHGLEKMARFDEEQSGLKETFRLDKMMRFDRELSSHHDEPDAADRLKRHKDAP